MGIALRSTLACAAALVLHGVGPRTAYAEPPADSVPPTAAEAPVPQGNFLSSLKQAFKQDFDHEVVRGHFDVGTPPDVHRYYCLVDAKTGQRQPNGVSGEPTPRPDGMTGIKAAAVSLYTCSSSEQQGMLVTSGYVLRGGAAAGTGAARDTPADSAAGVQKQATAPAVATAPASTTAPVGATAPVAAAGKVDVAGVKLGMSAEDVRVLLRAKHLGEYRESTGNLGVVEPAQDTSASGTRFVNVISTWSAPASAAVHEPGTDGEFFVVLFTPVPGQERAMAVVHSVGYAATDEVRETALAAGLVKKYGGYHGSEVLPAAATWRVQSTGEVQVGDECNRRALFGGLDRSRNGLADGPNLALNTAPGEFEFQIDRCGVAIITADHAVANAEVAPERRMILRFTVTAYSPLIGFQGATLAALMMQAARHPAAKGHAPTRDSPVPDL